MASAMECKEAKQKLSEALDVELESAEKAKVDEHLEGCASCRAESGELAQVHELVTDLAEPAVEVPSVETAWNRLDLSLGTEKPGELSPFEEVDEAPLITSGVMDIKGMVSDSHGQPVAGSEGQISTQDFFGLGDTGPGKKVAPASVAPPPVLMPVARRPAWLVPVFVAGGVLVLSVLALGVILFVGEGRKKKAEGDKVAQTEAGRPAAESAKEKEEGAADKADPTATASGPGKPGAVPPTAEAMAAPLDGAAGREAPVAGSGAKSSARRYGRRRYRPAGRRGGAYLSGGTRRSRGRPGRKAPAPTARARTSFSDDPLTALLGKGKTMGAGRPSPRPAASSLPYNLSRSQIRKVMSRASRSVKKCFETHKQPGLLRVSIAIKGSTGRIVSAAVRGKFKGTATARCALRTIRRLKFSRFGMVTQRFTYPFLLR